MLKLFVFYAVLELSFASIIQESHPNVIIMHVKNLLWNDLGIHANQKDSENNTPNIDYLAYSGIILKRFYANGGIDSLLSGCRQRSAYANTNLMSSYFERNGYSVNFITRSNYDKIDVFQRELLFAIRSELQPFLNVIDFGHLDNDIKIPYIDEIVGSVVTKVQQIGAMKNTIILFISLPDSNESPLEIDIRRTAFIYSPLLKLQQRVSNQLVHISDLLPTLVNATSLKWRTRDRIYIDGINLWQALSKNNGERLNIYGNNFFINNYWKLSYGSNGSLSSYGSIANEDMESDKDMTDYDFEAYVQSIFESEIHLVLNKLSSQKIMFLRSRTRVHCNLKDVNEAAVESIRCSRSSPCLFDLLEDPCEFDNKFEPEFDTRRAQMMSTFERFLSGETVDVVSVRSTEADGKAIEDGTMIGIILGASVSVCILVFIIVVCVKEKCNSKRSVYHDKTKRDTSDATTKSGGHENGGFSGENGIAVISQNGK